jgi:hypothetical protein
MDMSDGYSLTTTVRRDDLVQWLESLPDERRDVQVEQALALGFQVLTFVQASASEESMNRFFRPVLASMDDLSARLQTMMSFSNKSQRLGELGEAMVASQLQDAFPRDRFEIQSSGPHQADVKAVFQLGDGIEQAALIEVKLYTKDVPSTELDKFRSDLREQRQRFGLMVSLTSRLTGINGPFSIEARDDYVAVFVPNAGMDGNLLYWGASLVKALMLYERRAGVQIRSDAIALVFERLQADLAELNEAARQVAQLKDSVRRAQGKVNAALDELVDNAVNAEVRLKHVVERLEVRLIEELGELPRTTSELALPEPATANEVEAFLVELDKTNDKRGAGYRAIYAALQGKDVALVMEAGEWTLTRGEVRLAKTTSTKTRVDVQWAVGDAKRLTLDVGLESLKSNHIVMNGKDSGLLTERLLERLDE